MTTLIKFTNTNVKKIVSVYQLNYINNTSYGFGDFIRGCFYVMQLSKLLKIEFDMDISNHPINKYIENSGKNPNINYNQIEFVIGHNRPDHLWRNKQPYLNIDFANTIIDKLNNYHDSDTYYFFTNAFPIFYNFMDVGRQMMKNRLKPNNFMKDYIEYTLNELKLEKNTYSTIHIRTGDKYLNNGEHMNYRFIYNIKTKINKLIVPNKKYLIISDSNVFKLSLKSYPNFYILNRQIEHLGGDNLKSTDSPGVMNTLLDFYLMSYSNSIFCLSVHDHISGFSQYCSVINKIPFNYIIL
jgi:hypothetical protein